MKHLLPHMPVVAPSAHRFARQLSVSANADVLLFYFGWLLRIPLLGKIQTLNPDPDPNPAVSSAKVPLFLPLSLPVTRTCRPP